MNILIGTSAGIIPTNQEYCNSYVVYVFESFTQEDQQAMASAEAADPQS